MPENGVFSTFLGGFEPPTFRLGGGRSILLSYRNKYRYLLRRADIIIPHFD